MMQASSMVMDINAPVSKVNFILIRLTWLNPNLSLFKGRLPSGAKTQSPQHFSALLSLSTSNLFIHYGLSFLQISPF